MKCYNFFNKELSKQMANGLLYWLKIDTIICLFSMLMGLLISNNIGRKISILSKIERIWIQDMAGVRIIVGSELT